MPQAKSHTAAGAIATDKESKSSASQLGAFGVRLAKFTHRVSADSAADFSSNYSLPASSAILSISWEVTEAYNGTTVTAEVQAGGTPVGTATSVASTGVFHESPIAQANGELSINFSAVDSTEGEITVAVAYIDLSEIK